MDQWIVYRRRRKADVGSTYLAKAGYTWMKVSSKPAKWMLAHRWAMERKLGRSLLRGEAVHHTCRDRSCWNETHLELIDPAEHTTLHQTGRVQSKEHVQKRIAAAKRYWANPDNRAAHSDLLRSFWKKPEYRAKLQNGRKAGWIRRKASGKPHNSIGRKDSPGVIARRAASLSRYWRSHRGKAVELARQRWADPVYRTKQKAARLR